MCTAASYKTKDTYFGRNLDYEHSYGEEVVVMPRNYPLHFLTKDTIKSHYAMIGMASVMDDTALYYDAFNEKGLAIAGLNFVGNARYHSKTEGKDNIAQFEIIPWILSQCENISEAKALFERMNILDTPFKAGLPVAELHWLVSDLNETITVESVDDGLKIYDNPAGVLTNNPPFPFQMQNLANYRNVSAYNKEATFAKGLELPEYSRGMGGLGLPGDLSSQSRFVKVAFTRMNSLSDDSDLSSISQFFHILASVEQQRGCCDLFNDKYEITIYSSCCNLNKGTYYYNTYNNHQINCIDMHKENLDSDTLSRYPISDEEVINMIN